MRKWDGHEPVENRFSIVADQIQLLAKQLEFSVGLDLNRSAQLSDDLQNLQFRSQVRFFPVVGARIDGASHPRDLVGEEPTGLTA